MGMWCVDEEIKLDLLFLSLIFLLVLVCSKLFFLYQQIFDSQQFHVNEMLDEVYQTTNQLDIEYELEGKSIDDV